VRDSTSIKDYQDYIARNPKGTFVPLAKARIVGLRAAAAESIRTPAATQEAEDLLALTPTDRVELLRRLGAQNFFEGLPNGDPFTEEARRAIERWQLARTYPATGYLNKQQFDRLMSESPYVARPKLAPRKAERPSPEKRAPKRKDAKVINPVLRWHHRIPPATPLAPPPQ
jgi:hypothetical protein